MKLIIEQPVMYKKSPSDKNPRAGRLEFMGGSFWVREVAPELTEGQYDYAELDCGIFDNSPSPNKLIKLGKGK